MTTYFINIFHLYLQSNLLVIDDKYPHVVYVERETTKKVQEKACDVAGPQPSDLEGLLISAPGFWR